ncbi:zeta toxin family protein [Arundinibacter roseus]|nr:zeta toxin family protein [Arundinibacter roseus]
MTIKRMRVFAGPNGSGKTTIVNSLRSEIGFGIYVNADDIESQLKETRVMLFSSFQLYVIEDELHDYFKTSNFSPLKRAEPDLWSKLTVKDNVLFVDTFVDSYLAADLSEFLRQSLLKNGISFTYETVMSHESKVKFLQRALDSGYRVYLYFVATEDPQINVSRVNIRVAQHGHFVAPELVTTRYYKSLQQLKKAIKKSSRAYLWDNSGAASLLIAEITDGSEVHILDSNYVPNWFVDYVVN